MECDKITKSWSKKKRIQVVCSLETKWNSLKPRRRTRVG